MSASFTFVTLVLLFLSASALQSAVKLRIDSSQEEADQQEASQEEGEHDGNEEEVDHSNDFYKTWYETSAGESTVHEEHDIPEEELADKFDTGTQIIGGDASLGGAALEEEAEIPGGITFGDEPSALNASAKEANPMQRTVKENNTEVTRKAQTSAQDQASQAVPSAAAQVVRGGAASVALEKPQAAADDNAVHGIDEFAPPVKVKAAEEENAVHGVDEFADTSQQSTEADSAEAAVVKEASQKKVHSALAVLLGKEDADKHMSGKSDDEAESPGAKAASEKKAEEALAKLLGRPIEAEQVISSVASKAPVVALDLTREKKILDKSMPALSWKPPELVYSFCNLSQATLLFFGVAFVIMAMGTVDFLVLRRSKHQASAYEVTGTHVSKEHSAKHMPAPTSCRLHDIVEGDGKCGEEDSLMEEVEDDDKKREKEYPMNVVKAMPAPMDEEKGQVSKPEAVVLKKKAALTGTSWLSRKLGLICYAR